MAVRAAAVAAALILWPPSSARADWILGGYLGHAATLSSTVTFDIPGRETRVEAEGATYRGESFQFPLYYGYRVTWVPDQHPWIGFEYEFIHAKVHAETDRPVRLRGTLRGAPVDASVPLSSVASRLAMSHGLNFILANVAVRRGFGPAAAGAVPRFVAVARAGAGPTLPHAESTIDGVDREQYEGGGLGIQAAGGLEIALWRGLGAVGEYKWTWAKPTIDLAGGEATIPSGSHHLAIGFSYRF